MQTLVIVESPGKTGPIQKYLGAGYTVVASIGHICDLPTRDNPAPAPDGQQPWANLGIEPGTYRALYVVSPDKRQVVARIRALVAKADRVFLAMDADREGEGIAWHVARETGIKNPQRITFSEITPEALRAAVAAPRPLDMNLVAAQETRRIIDRYVGYGLSPLLWNAVQGKNEQGRGLSAGRVQSAALMLIARRELSRMRFIPASFWTVKFTAHAENDPAGTTFLASVQLVRSKAAPAGLPLANAGDYGPDGKLKADRTVALLSRAQIDSLTEHLGRTGAVMEDVTRTEVVTRPPPPLITSSLQRAAGSLGMTADAVMAVAQKLYNAGHISYMRIDTPHLSDEAKLAASREAERLFGPDAGPIGGRQYATRDKNAQEAHEAIRPSGAQIIPPEHKSLTPDELTVYTLVYRRAVASQMHDARHAKTVLDLRAPAANLTAKGRVLLSPGFTQMLPARARDEDAALPDVQVGAAIALTAPVTEQVKTEPRERFTEGTLIDALKAAGIGRPSTYVSTLRTLAAAGYSVPSGKALTISNLGLLVTTYLSRHVAPVVAREFTSQMEEGLDQIAAGQLSAHDYLQRFWTGQLEPMMRRAPRTAPQLALPHLPGAVLISTLGGPQLEWNGVRQAVSERAVPGDLRKKDASAIAAGTWKVPTPKTATARKPAVKKAAKSGAKKTVTKKPAAKKTTPATLGTSSGGKPVPRKRSP